MMTRRQTGWILPLRAITTIAIGGIVVSCISSILTPINKPYYAILADQTSMSNAKIQINPGPQIYDDDCRNVPK